MHAKKIPSITCNNPFCNEQKGGKCEVESIYESRNERELLFLRESNAIESVYDTKSLVQAVKAWEYLTSKRKLTQEVIKKTHEILMKYQSIAPEDKGSYRQCKVWVGSHEGITHHFIPQYLENWLYISSRTKVADNKAEWIRQLHMQYEQIHPFIDGNGRTGRMFMNWQRLKTGLPLMVIFEKYKYDYYKWFN